MKIPTTTLPLNALTPHPENYNTHPASQIKELAESLSTFGQFKNIVTWTCPENMTTPEGHELHEGLTYILAGHGLWLAAMEAGVDELEVKDYSGISYEMAIGLLLIDNAAPLGSEPDSQRLAALLERTREMTADRPGLGAMLERLKERAGINGNGQGINGDEPPMPTETEAEKLAKQYGVESGQAWQLGRHRLVISDSTNEATRKEFVKGDEYLFTDPPYGIGVDTSWLSALNVQRGKPANLSDDQLQGDDGTLDPSFLFKFERRFIWGFPYIYDPDATGWIVWDKQPGVSERGIVTPVELASTTLRKGFDMVRLMWGGFYRAAGEERHPHPTQKPMGVFLPFIQDWTKEGDKVFDPFVGSGTTLLCCEKLGRVCTGFDIHAPYAAVTIHRWQQMTGQTPKLITSGGCII